MSFCAFDDSAYNKIRPVQARKSPRAETTRPGTTRPGSARPIDISGLYQGWVTLYKLTLLMLVTNRHVMV